MVGFVTFDRNIFDHPFFKRGPMTECEAFMWMISNAAWTDIKHRLGPIMFDVSCGSFVATLRELQSRFMWNSDKIVRTPLKGHEKKNMAISIRVGPKNKSNTHVNICNQDKYQSRGRIKVDDNLNFQKVGKQTYGKTYEGRTTDAVKKQGNNINYYSRSSKFRL